MSQIVYALMYCFVGTIIIYLGLKDTPREIGCDPRKWTKAGKNRCIAVGLIFLTLLPEAYRALFDSQAFTLVLIDAIKQIATVSAAALAGSYMDRGYNGPSGDSHYSDTEKND